jgi:hypothetical protein
MPAFRFVAIGSAVLLSGMAAPAYAVISLNALTSNALTSNALTSNALTATRSAMSDLNGVAIGGISLPSATRR